MAHLARPVNMLPPSVERILEFKGLNRRSVVAEGEMSDMWNLTSDNYPVLTQRKPRGLMNLPPGVIRPLQLLSKHGKIAMIAVDDDGTNFYYDGSIVSQVTGLSESTRMVSINNKVCSRISLSPERLSSHRSKSLFHRHRQRS